MLHIDQFILCCWLYLEFTCLKHIQEEWSLEMLDAGLGSCLLYNIKKPANAGFLCCMV